MKYLKNASKVVGIMIIFLISLAFIITFLNYFNIVGKEIVSIMEIIIPIITLFIGGFLIGKRSLKKGWFEGIKLGLIFIFILFLFQILGIQEKFEIKTFLYYLILIGACVIGSMLGISKNKTLQ